MRALVRLPLGAAAAAAAALLLSSAIAFAARPATPDELAAIAGGQGIEAACVTATVSTVDASWARIQNAPVPPASCMLGDGFIVVHLRSGAWQNVTEGSEPFPCPAADVPLAVGRDLGVCRAPRAYLLCLPSKTSTLRVTRQHPTACVTLGPQDALCCAANLVRLHWRHWGGVTATATGRERGFHLPLENIPVRVTASRRRVADCGDYVYTRLKVTSRFGTLRQRIPAVCGDSA